MIYTKRSKGRGRLLKDNLLELSRTGISIAKFRTAELMKLTEEHEEIRRNHGPVKILMQGGVPCNIEISNRLL